MHTEVKMEDKNKRRGSHHNKHGFTYRKMQFNERHINIDSKMNKATYFTTKLLVTNLIR